MRLKSHGYFCVRLGDKIIEIDIEKKLDIFMVSGLVCVLLFV